MATPLAIQVRTYTKNDCLSLIDIFRSSVREVGIRHYTLEQTLVWAPDTIDSVTFNEHCQKCKTWVAHLENKIVGFSQLEADGHIDMTYVHPAYQRQGIARSLLSTIEKSSKDSGLKRLYVEASIGARPLFEKLGFNTITPQTVERRGQSFLNYKMEKVLPTTSME